MTSVILSNSGFSRLPVTLASHLCIRPGLYPGASAVPDADCPAVWDPSPMRWLLAALLVSLVALLFAAAGAAWHIRRENRRRAALASQPQLGETDSEEAP
jgi:hypothetical protein